MRDPGSLTNFTPNKFPFRSVSIHIAPIYIYLSIYPSIFSCCLRRDLRSSSSVLFLFDFPLFVEQVKMHFLTLVRQMISTGSSFQVPDIFPEICYTQLPILLSFYWFNKAENRLINVNHKNGFRMGCFTLSNLFVLCKWRSNWTIANKNYLYAVCLKILNLTVW